jgi:hypothetical protein
VAVEIADCTKFIRIFGFMKSGFYDRRFTVSSYTAIRL